MERSRRADIEFSTNGHDPEMPCEDTNPRAWNYDVIKERNPDLGTFLERAHEHLVSQDSELFYVPAQIRHFIDDIHYGKKENSENSRVGVAVNFFRTADKYDFFKKIPSVGRQVKKSDFETMMARFAYAHLVKGISDKVSQKTNRTPVVIEKGIEELADHPLGVYFRERGEVYIKNQKNEEIKLRLAKKQQSKNRLENWMDEFSGEFTEEESLYKPSDLRSLGSRIREEHPDWWIERDISSKFRKLGISDGFIKRINFMNSIDKKTLKQGVYALSPAGFHKYLYELADEMEIDALKSTGSLRDVPTLVDVYFKRERVFKEALKKKREERRLFEIRNSKIEDEKFEHK